MAYIRVLLDTNTKSINISTTTNTQQSIMFHVLNHPLWKSISVGCQSTNSIQKCENSVEESVQQIYKTLNKNKHQIV